MLLQLDTWGIWIRSTYADGRLVARAELLVDLKERHQYVAHSYTGIALLLVPRDAPRGGQTYWFIKLVLPTPLSPRIMTLSRTFFLDDILDVL